MNIYHGKCEYSPCASDDTKPHEVGSVIISTSQIKRLGLNYCPTYPACRCSDQNPNPGSVISEPIFQLPRYTGTLQHCFYLGKKGPIFSDSKQCEIFIHGEKRGKQLATT